MNSRILVVLMALFLAACGGEEQEVSFNWDRASLIYSYPADGQAEVPLNAPLVLRYSDALTTDDPLAEISLETQGGVPVPVSAALSADGRSIVITPDEPLTPATAYVLNGGDQDTDLGGPFFPEDGIAFTSRINPDGAGQGARTDDVFRVARMIPDGDTMPLMDFSSLRLQFTQPVDRGSLEYGDPGAGASVSLLDDAGMPVAANVIASGPYLTIDPVNDLTPGNAYELVLTDELKSTLGNDLVPGDYGSLSVIPEDSGVGATLVQEAPVSNDDPAQQCGPDTAGDRLSPLTGEPVNCVPIASLLLGNRTSSQQQGDVFAELASLNRYPEMTPLRIGRGSLLRGASVDVNVAGEVPVRFASGDASTGEITVKFVSDANGYMFRNPYSDADDAPRHIRLWMDVAMNTANTEANAGLSQDLLHLELVGTAIIIDGRMTINAVGVVEPEVLGLETASGTLSFHMESYLDQENAPAPAVDEVNPVVQSWAPGDHPDKHRPGDPIIVNFNEPVDRNSLAQDGALEIYKDGSDTPLMESEYDWYLDGASLVIHLDGGLQFGSEYRVAFNLGMVTDLSGNYLDDYEQWSGPAPWDGSLSFTMPEYVGSGAPPIALTTYPGFPCAKANGTLDLANDAQGRCRGGEGGDDTLPVMPLPGNRAIRVQFSQNMNPDSIALGAACGEGTFRVERIATDGSGNPVVDGNGNGVCDAAVPGILEVTARKLKFTPDQPWEQGALYRYTLMSENNDFDASDCTRVQTQPASGDVAICSTADLGLQTAILDGPDTDQGGPNMHNYFRGAENTTAVFQSLRNLPTSDINGNYVLDAQEPQPVEDPDNPGQYPVPTNGAKLGVVATGGLLLDANVGCAIGDSCPDRKFLHVTGGLDAEVAGYDATEDAVRVNIFPTLIMTTTEDVYANILLLGEDTIPTGAQVMRVRYEDRGSGRVEPVTGWIRDTDDGPVFETSLDVYMSAPYLAPEALGITLQHDLYSYPLTLELSGDVTFLPDGRMQIQQVNVTAPDNIVVNLSLLGIGAASMTMAIPQNGVNLNYSSSTIKE